LSAIVGSWRVISRRGESLPRSTVIERFAADFQVRGTHRASSARFWREINKPREADDPNQFSASPYPQQTRARTKKPDWTKRAECYPDRK
jgi:hypothetical protein